MSSAVVPHTKGPILAPREFFASLCEELNKEMGSAGVYKPWHDQEGYYLGPVGRETLIVFSDKPEHQKRAAERPNKAIKQYVASYGREPSEDSDMFESDTKQIRKEHESFGTLCMMVPRRLFGVAVSGYLGHEPALTLQMMKRDAISVDFDLEALDEADRKIMLAIFNYWQAHRPISKISLGRALDIHELMLYSVV